MNKVSCHICIEHVSTLLLDSQVADKGYLLLVAVPVHGGSKLTFVTCCNLSIERNNMQA
jgi:hypothetical protein